MEKLEVGEPLSVDQLLVYLPTLKELPRAQVDNWAKGAAVLRRFSAGEEVCREGEFGSTAFYIVSGNVDIYIASQIAHLKSKSTSSKWFGRTVARMQSSLVSEKDDRRGHKQRQFIPIDAPIDLSLAKPLAQLGPGELFGEMTCRTFQPRSATVRAKEDCVMVEMLRVVLDMLMGTRQIDEVTKLGTKVKAPTFKGTSFKAEMDRKYRERALANQMRSVPLFASLDEEFLNHFKKAVELVSYNKGQVICHQGDAPDAFYLIRQGMVKVSQAMPGGEMVRTYLGRGDYFGEIGLLLGQDRNATCTALDTVDLVCIKASDFHFMVKQFPEIGAQLAKVSEARLKAAAKQKMPTGMNLDEFLNQGLFEAQNLLLIDLNRCTRCDLCVNACADAHDGVTRLLRDGLRYDKYLIATTCRTCQDPLCMTQCPVGSIRRRDSLEIIIEDWCIGCSKCAELCPYGNINMHQVEAPPESPPLGTRLHGLADKWRQYSLIDAFGLKRATSTPVADAPAAPAEKKKSSAQKAATCDLCTEHQTPSCVYACPHDAAMRVEPGQFFGRKLSASLKDETRFEHWKNVKQYDSHVTHRKDFTSGGGSTVVEKKKKK